MTIQRVSIPRHGTGAAPGNTEIPARGVRPRQDMHALVSRAVFLLMTFAAAACSNSPSRPEMASGWRTDSNTGDAGARGQCMFPATGCPCAEEQATHSCGEVQEQVGNEIWCLQGTRTCSGGVWGKCIGQRTVTAYGLNKLLQRNLLGLATGSVACGNACDPSCQNMTDTPDGVDAGDHLVANDAGMSIAGNGSCATIVVTPNATTTPSNTVPTDPTTSTSNYESLQFKATCGLDGPDISSVVVWSIGANDLSIASIDQTGLFKVYVPIGKDVTIYARTSAATGLGTAHVTYTQSTGTCSNAALFNSATNTPDPATVLYPYAVPARPVVFPLSLTAPYLLYGTGGTTANCVRTTLCYPSGSCSTNPTKPVLFRWDKYVSGADPKQGPVDNTVPAVSIDQTAWNIFSTSAKGDTADLILQRVSSAGKLMMQETVPVRFATDALRGTVYFTQYQSNFTSSCSGQSFSFSTSGYPATNASDGKLGGAAPTCPVGYCTHVSGGLGSRVVSINLAVPGSAPVDTFSKYDTTNNGCPVCHSVSADGGTLVTTGNLYQLMAGFSGLGVGLNKIMSDGTLKPVADVPEYSFPWDNYTYGNIASNSASNFPFTGGKEAIEDSRGWAYGAISPDGKWILQGPNYWGNTRDDISTDSAQDGSYGTSSTAGPPSAPPGAGNKRYFLLNSNNYGPVKTWDASNPTSSFDPSVDYATDGPLPAYTASSTVLTAVATGSLAVHCRNNGTNFSPAQGKVLLVKNEVGSNAKYNGVYLVTTNSSSTQWKLTRTTATDTTGELAYDQRFRVDSGKTSNGTNYGQTTGQFQEYFRVTTPGTPALGTAAVNFALWTTVRAATTQALPNNPVLDGNVLTATTNGAFGAALDNVPLVTAQTRILVKDQVDATQNGIYTLTTPGSSSSTWQLTRSVDFSGADFSFVTSLPLQPTSPGAVRSGQTLTAGSNSAFITTGSISSTIAGSVAGLTVINVARESDSTINGLYTVSNLGSSTSAWQMTRCSSCTTSHFRTTSALAAPLYLVAAGNGTLSSTPFNSAPSVNQTVKVQNQTDSSQNGCYQITSLGSSTSPWQMVRIGATCASFNIWTKGVISSAALVMQPASNGALIGTGSTIYVAAQADDTQNGLYALTTAGSSSTKWVLTAAQAGAASLGARVRVTEGTLNGGKEYELTSGAPSPLAISGSTLVFTAQPYDSVLASTAMMVPEFSPDGSKLLYVNGDADTGTGLAATGWRRGLSMLNFDSVSGTFSNKTRLVNNYSGLGAHVKWPFFESDSRSVVYVETDPAEFCPRAAGYGQCGNEACSTSDGTINTKIERACFGNVYGNMSPTTRGYWWGKLRSVDSSTPGASNAELKWLNSNNGALDSADQNKAYQPTVLPFSAGGYRWVIFTSPRSYGNQLNAVGTDFSCSSALLWMAALDDSTASSGDRSYPAFLLPGQQLGKINTTANHYVNERGYLVPSPCKTVGTSCTVNEECCDGAGSAPINACVVQPTTPVTRQCAAIPSCMPAGQPCKDASDCCVPGSSCFEGVCASPPVYNQASFTRDYHVDCKQTMGVGYRVAWGHFYWHARAAGSTSIAFAGQSNSTGKFSAADTSVALGSANASNINAPPANFNDTDVSAAFQAASATADSYLRVTMTFNPSTDGLSTPTLFDWNITYTCVPVE